jgi:hypothetical protein
MDRVLYPIVTLVTVTCLLLAASGVARAERDLTLGELVRVPCLIAERWGAACP